MTQLEFFKSISEHLSQNSLSPLFLIMIIFFAIFIILLMMLALLNAKREKMDEEILFFLKKRHRLREFEMEAMLKIGRKQKLTPEYLIIMESNLFKKYREKIKKEIVKVIKYEKQADEIMSDLDRRLFK